MADSKSFKNSDEVQFYYAKALENMKKYGHLKAGEYVELFVESCLAEQEFDEGYTTLLKEIATKGLNIEFDRKTMSFLKDRLFQLRFMKKLIHAMDLGAYEEKILDVEIKNLFERGSDTSKPKKA
jgi:hypothetical protein